jgi:hypothetical protein
MSLTYQGWEVAAQSEDNRILGMCGLVSSISKGTSDRDLILVGKHGYIWQYSDTHYQIVVTGPSVGNKYLNLQDKMKRGEEVGLLVPEEEAKVWLKRLRVPNRRVSQLKLMEDRINGKG